MNKRHLQRLTGVVRRRCLGNLALMMALGLSCTMTATTQAQKFSVLHAFNYSDGAEPAQNVLIQDSAGNLYGTVDYGAKGGCFFGCGVVFKLSAPANNKVLYRFTGHKDGGMPRGLMVRDDAGTLYGTTIVGGNTGNRCGGFGCGTIFKLDRTGKETVLYNFTGKKDGSYPQGGIVRDSAGTLYGIATNGGASGDGIIFKLDTNGKFIVLHTFQSATDGQYPSAGLIRDSKGNLYGTTADGGTGGGDGTVFRLGANGRFTVLHVFQGGNDGQYPGYGALFLDAAGNLYGTTTQGGITAGGVVFKVTKAAKETVLHSFGATGYSPSSNVVQDENGNLYGTTYYGGHSSSGCVAITCGIVYKLDTAGKETVLHGFTGGDGGNPYSALFQDANGNLYGSTYSGGAHGLGTVFKITLH